MASQTIVVTDGNLRCRMLIGASLELVFSVLRIVKAATMEEAIDKIKLYNPVVALIDAGLCEGCTGEQKRILHRQLFFNHLSEAKIILYFNGRLVARQQ